MKNKYKNKFIENEIKSSYLNYAISVIVDRALPDIRDGLKPVHRRILYSMYLLNNLHNKKYKKSARIVGDVIGKYHPHGDIAVYDSIVRMAQNFSLRYPLIKGQGNFGSIDGDSAAAMRYTEIKMSKISEELLKDIDKNTVNFIKNYDNTEYIPEILPSKIPNLLINGSHGIAVGVATNIPPHNINEIMNACIKILDNKYITTEEIMNDIIGPDFPTGGIIKGKKNILEAYKNGKGKISLYSKIKIENNNIIILEIPYQVNKLKLIEKIIELIKNKEIIGISNINDESDKDGLRIVIEVKKEFSCYKILNNLYINTQLKINFGINMIAIKNNKPKLFTLKKILLSYINHRKNIILKKSNFLFKNNINKINKLISIIIAIYNIKYIINIITNSKTIEIVKKYFINKEFNIIHNYNNINNNIFINYLIKNNILINKNLIKLKDEQIDIILNLRLNKLINLEYEKILYKFIKNINENDKLYLILNNKKELINEIKNELIYIKNEYSDKRLTKIIDQDINIKKKNLIKKDDVIITLTKLGYIKYQNLSEYKIQKRGGRGKILINLKNNLDELKITCISNTYDDLLLFSNLGKVYILKTYEISKFNKYNLGKLINNIFSLLKNEYITYIISIKLNNLINKKTYLIICLNNGIIKKTLIDLFKNKRNNGILAININNEDIKIIGVSIIYTNNLIILSTLQGKFIKFNENKIKLTQRNSYGVKSIKLQNNDKVISLDIIKNNEYILTITENGYGKKTKESEYNEKSRLTLGSKLMKINDKTGKIIKSIVVNDKNDLFIINNLGMILKIKSIEIKVTKKNTMGVLLMNIKNKNEKIINIIKY